MMRGLGGSWVLRRMWRCGRGRCRRARRRVGARLALPGLEAGPRGSVGWGGPAPKGMVLWAVFVERSLVVGWAVLVEKSLVVGGRVRGSGAVVVLPWLRRQKLAEVVSLVAMMELRALGGMAWIVRAVGLASALSVVLMVWMGTKMTGMGRHRARARVVLSLGPSWCWRRCWFWDCARAGLVGEGARSKGRKRRWLARVGLVGEGARSKGRVLRVWWWACAIVVGKRAEAWGIWVVGIVLWLRRPEAWGIRVVGVALRFPEAWGLRAFVLWAVLRLGRWGLRAFALWAVLRLGRWGLRALARCALLGGLWTLSLWAVLLLQRVELVVVAVLVLVLVLHRWGKPMAAGILAMVRVALCRPSVLVGGMRGARWNAGVEHGGPRAWWVICGAPIVPPPP